MAKYIDADTVVGLMMFDDWGRTVETDTIENILDNFTEDGCPEPADVVQVVRCRDCKYVRKYRSEESAKKFGQVYECVRYTIPCPNPDDFCSYGERKEE